MDRMFAPTFGTVPAAEGQAPPAPPLRERSLVGLVLAVVGLGICAAVVRFGVTIPVPLDIPTPLDIGWL